jgi:endo-1,4-beta-mannosidase
MRRVCFYVLLFLIGMMQGCAPKDPPESTMCSAEQIDEALEATGDYTPFGKTDFVKLQDGQLPFVIRGINYYPARYPWRRFLTETDGETLLKEFTLMRAININTLRIFLPNDEAVPHDAHFGRLDYMIRAAAGYGFHLIVTLNDLPDRSLYDNPPRIQNQIRFIVERYRDEPTILAWDLRNEGDIDYGSHPNIEGRFTKNQVLGWLGETAALVREPDPNHLITAGWLYHAEDTAPYVDFISFHHWTGTGELKDRIAKIRAVTDKPILLQETGYSLYHSGVTPEVQAQNIEAVIEVAEQNALLGWMIWTAFDFPLDASCYPSPCKSQDNAEHHFGIWYADYTEKPAVDVIRRGTN